MKKYSQSIHEKMFNKLSHHRNANQNYIEILSHSSQNGYDQENKQQQMLARMQAGQQGIILIH
jgi:hypothetical protein